MQHQDLKYTWDAAGNLTTREDIVTPYREDFTYDFLDRLSSASTSQSISTGLLGHWKLDEGSGTTASDSSGNGYHGTLVNGPSWVDGRFEKALSFDGVDDYVDGGQVLDFERTDPFSVSVWFKKSQSGHFDGLVSRMDATGPNYRGWLLSIPGDDIVRFQLRSTETSAMQVSTTQTVPVGVWTHITVTYDGSSLASGVEIYINGVKQGLTVEQDNLAGSTLAGSTADFNIGARDDGVGSAKGDIDEVRVYDRALGSDEVEALYNQYYETYAYNALGNITSKTGQGSYTYGSQPHAVTSTAMGGSFVYDLNGNMTSRNGATLTWDVENRVTAYGGTATFTYDGDGGRVLKAEGGDTVHYVNRYYEKNVTTGVATVYYWHGGKLVAVKKASTLEYVHTDHLGSVSRTTDTGGALVRREDDFPYGTVRAESGAAPTERSFTGQRRDGTGLLFYNARYYAPSIGRFVSADTIVPDPSNSQALNRYAYVYNNPLKYVDPSGRVVEIHGIDVNHIDEVGFGTAFGSSSEEVRQAAHDLWIAYLNLRWAVRQLTNYLENELVNANGQRVVVNIEMGKTANDKFSGQAIPYGVSQVERVEIRIGPVSSGNIGKLAGQLAHEGFHAAVVVAMNLVPTSQNFAANEAFAYSLQYQVEQFFNRGHGQGSERMKGINPWLDTVQLESRLLRAS